MKQKVLFLSLRPGIFPVNLSLIPVISAISSGNCIVLKPSEITENTSKVIKLIIEKHLKRMKYE